MLGQACGRIGKLNRQYLLRKPIQSPLLSNPWTPAICSIAACPSLSLSDLRKGFRRTLAGAKCRRSKWRRTTVIECAWCVEVFIALAAGSSSVLAQRTSLTPALSSPGLRSRASGMVVYGFSPDREIVLDSLSQSRRHGAFRVQHSSHLPSVLDDMWRGLGDVPQAVDQGRRPGPNRHHPRQALATRWSRARSESRGTPGTRCASRCGSLTPRSSSYPRP